MSQERDSARRIGRRRLLRRAGGVAAGAAGAAVVGAAVAPSPAAAATGGNLVLGQANDAGTNATSVTVNSSTASTLELSNAATSSYGSIDYVGAQLRLVPPPASQNPQSPYYGEPGAITLTSNFQLWMGSEPGRADQLYTSATANQLAPITPTRILDTRIAGGRTSVMDPIGNLDSSGRLIGGHAIHVDLSSLVMWGIAVHANLTVVLPVNQGFASLLPGALTFAGEPATSNLNYMPGAIVPNAAMSAITVWETSNDVVQIFSTSTTHVLLDVFAFTVNLPGQINPSLLPIYPSAPASTAGAKKSRAEMARSADLSWSK